MATQKKSGSHLFIDTNILLNFFAYSKDDLKQLDKLIKLVHAKTIRLYLTQQIVDEFARNRDAKLAESFTKFKLLTSGCPSFMLAMPEYSLYLKSLNAFEKNHSILTNAAKIAAKNRELAADKTFLSLVKKAIAIPITDDDYAAATRRRSVGNPPGKSDSLGDQLNWEVLLRSVPKGASLHIVTKDGDYGSKLNAQSPNMFLSDEWKETHDGQLLIYEQIGHFFQQNFPDEDFSLDIEKREAIDSLLNSGAFASTHSAIASLSPYLSFLTDEEAEEIVQGSLSNSQISWIVSDPDVEKFFKSLLEEYGDNVSPRLKERLEELLEIEDEDDDVDEDDDEDDDNVPF